MNTRLSVKVIPKASKTEIVGWEGELLKIRLAAVPEKGQANQALCAFLAKALGLSRSKVCVFRGETSRTKIVDIEDLTHEQILERLKQP